MIIFNLFTCGFGECVFVRSRPFMGLSHRDRTFVCVCVCVRAVCVVTLTGKHDNDNGQEQNPLLSQY